MLPLLLLTPRDWKATTQQRCELRPNDVAECGGKRSEMDTSLIVSLGKTWSDLVSRDDRAQPKEFTVQVIMILH